MRSIFAIASLHLKEFFKTPSSIVLMFVLPIIFGIIFGGMSTNSETTKPLVNIVTYKGEVNSQVVNLLEKNGDYQWEKASEKQARQNVLKQDAIAAVIIPDDIGKRLTENKPVLDIIVQRKTEAYLGLVPHLEGTAQVVNSSYQAVKGMDEKAFPVLLKAVAGSKGVKIDQEIVQKNDELKQSVNLMFVGFAIMFMMFGLSGASSTILDEKKGGTWSRILTTPASKLQIIMGYLFSYFLMGWIQFVTLMVAMSLLFDSTWGDLSYMIPFASLVILCVVGFGLMIAGLVKTKQQAAAIGTVIIVSTCMLGGLYWPLDIVPEIMRKISLGVPQSWAMSGFKEIISGSLHTETLIKDSLALVGFTVFFFLIGLRLVKYE